MLTTSLDLIPRNHSEIFLTTFRLWARAEPLLTLWFLNLHLQYPLSLSMPETGTSWQAYVISWRQCYDLFFQRTYFQLSVSINVSYVWRIQQHLQSRMCGYLYSRLEGTFFGIDSRVESPILSIGYNAPWVPIEKYGENFEVYDYQENQDPPEILDRGTYAAAYDIPTGVTIILAFHNGLRRNNHINVLLLPPFMMRESVWEVKYAALQHCPVDGDPNRHCLIMTTSGEQSDINIDIELLNTHPRFQIHLPTTKDIRNLPWYELTSQADWDPYSPLYGEKDHTAKLRRDCWGGQTMHFRTINNVLILTKHLPSREDPWHPVHYIYQASASSQALCNMNPALNDFIFRELISNNTST